MEFFTIFLSSLFGLVSPAGLVVESTAQKAVRSQFAHVEKLQVRIDNSPTHQLLNGKVQRIRIAGRGLQLKQPSLRVGVLELESDPVDINLGSRRQLQLEQPLQAGVRLVLKQQDINQALRSPELTAKLSNLGIILQPQSQLGQAPPAYNLVNPRLELLANNRLRFQVELTQANTTLAIRVETAINLIAGRQIQLLELVIYVNQEEVPQQLVRAIANNLGKQLNLANLEVYGIQAKILKLQIEPDQIEVAAFFRLDPFSPFLTRRT